MKFITTSWDDGSPHDIRLSELLGKYNLQGTFYIPRQNEEHRVMPEKEIVELSRHFEIGGHTLNHKSLKISSGATIRHEVGGSFLWLQQILNAEPVSFCLPFGHYNRESIRLIYESGFRYIRTTELLSPVQPALLSHTTVQVYPHSRFTYFKHLLKHKRLGNLGLWMRGGCQSDHLRLLDQYLDFIQRNDGCLHVWGHSWEIDEYNLWTRLEIIFKHISNHSGFRYVKNKELIASACIQ